MVAVGIGSSGAMEFMADDFDVTDSYQVPERIDQFALMVKTGATIAATVEPLPDGSFGYTVELRRADGSEDGRFEGQYNDAEMAHWMARSRVRDFINREEPLGSPVNWGNSELVDLLMEQERIVLCPVCMGDEDGEPCIACGGSSWIETGDLEKYVDFDDDSEPDDA